ncbi:hypothetical protein ACQ31_gp197 [Salmonella phage STML-198]|uniref:Uncharacterized protein n=2 Tax=Gelderlandvirus TaxID=1913653 RepID=K4I653_9CAUD|nr:hypothetical protein ACQ31_gp197 [Salmonella phage STML-198]YP_009615617.1 hypothetical protein FDI73_gp259 [Salmonella phage Melville]AFU64080.1 hypothetical protein [Salmonella phage STML-198]ATN93105.1 hypothetical protein CPT_Melville_142 [Salmonella phage Melville]UPW42502.1 hypothetical protein EBPHNEJP_00215 [Salmonella phage CF-SP2]
MKRCELIRNISAVLCLGGFGFSTMAGSLEILSQAETMSAFIAVAVLGVVSFVMDKISNEKA